MNPDEQRQVIEGLTKEFISQWELKHGRHATENMSPHHVDRVRDLTLQLSRLSLPALSSSELSLTSKAAQSSTATADNEVSIGPSPSIYEQEFLNQFLSANETARRYDDKELLMLTADVVPIARIFKEAEARTADHPEDSLDDVVVRRLLHWFKNEFFTWVNEPPCDVCQGKTAAIGRVAPSSQERADGAGIVEIYRCTNGCTAQTRFPRYNQPKILLETRKGRCGEWANCFTLCCRAIGFKARYVHDTTDHVWTEVWSDHKQRWIHCDSCEEAYDQPLLYSTGWNKSLSYCVAFSVEEAVDVTRRYTVDFQSIVMKRRRSVREAVLAQFLRTITQKNMQRLGLSPVEVEEIYQRQAQEQAEMTKLQTQSREEETTGRESGSLDWRKARGETRD